MTSTEPLLLIHGLFGSLSAPKILDAFAPGPVLAPDLMGYGVHRATQGDWTLADQAAHVADSIRASGLEPMHVVGHSVGGAVAVLFAAAYPDLCRSVTSVEGNFTLKDAFWSQQISRQSIEEVEAIVDTYNPMSKNGSASPFHTRHLGHYQLRATG